MNLTLLEWHNQARKRAWGHSSHWQALPISNARLRQMGDYFLILYRWRPWPCGNPHLVGDEMKASLLYMAVKHSPHLLRQGYHPYPHKKGWAPMCDAVFLLQDHWWRGSFFYARERPLFCRPAPTPFFSPHQCDDREHWYGGHPL